jgi:PAS domain S-box-containing protein
MAARSRSRFLSLKWKVLLSLGALMLSANAALSWLHYQHLMTRFEEQRAETRERLVAQAFALRNEVGLRLQALAGILAALDSVGASLFQSAAGNALLRQHFESYWPALQLDYGIDSLHVYARTGSPLASWTTAVPAEMDVDGHVRAVIASERAMHWTRCRELCTQFAAAPILSDGKVAGAVVLGSSLADVVNSFRDLTLADLGVLIPAASSVAGTPHDEAFLPRLGLRVITLSNKGQDRPLLQQLVSIPSLAGPPGYAHLSLPYAGRQYELSFLVLDAPDGARLPAMMVVIDDLTRTLAEIRSSVLNGLQGELLASLLSLLLLALLVHAPLKRMTRTAQAIPLLGRSAFAEARTRIAPRGRRLVDDEIDSLDEAAIALSYRLETLERDVAAHSAETEGMLQRISVERDFSKSLLDTAQVIILTQSADGRIHTLNRCGRQLSGWEEEDLPAKLFFELIGSDPSQLAAVQQALLEIDAGDRQHVQLESILQSKSGEAYEITWNHSRLAGQPGGAVMILSVGIDHTERKRAESHVSYLAEHDPLTGLVNRQHFQHELDQALIDAAVQRMTGRCSISIWTLSSTSTTSADTRQAMRCCGSSPMRSAMWRVPAICWGAWAATNLAFCCTNAIAMAPSRWPRRSTSDSPKSSFPGWERTIVFRQASASSFFPRPRWTSSSFSPMPISRCIRPSPRAALVGTSIRTGRASRRRCRAVCTGRR